MAYQDRTSDASKKAPDLSLLKRYRKYPVCCRFSLNMCLHTTSTLSITQPPRSPNSLAQSSYSFRPCLLTLGLIFLKLASKSSNCIGLISSIVICKSFSPRLRKGPIAASLASAVMSDPENPKVVTSQRLRYFTIVSTFLLFLPSVSSTNLSRSSSETLCFWWPKRVCSCSFLT